MFKIEKKFFFNLKILKFLLISPILFSIPVLTNINEAKAGLEFQWDQDSGYKRLKWYQKENKRKFRNTIYFFLRPSDRKDGILKVNLAIPKSFKTKLKKENISLQSLQNLRIFVKPIKILDLYKEITKRIKKDENPYEISLNKANLSLINSKGKPPMFYY